MTPKQSQITVYHSLSPLAAVFALVAMLALPAGASAALAFSDFEAGIDGWLGYSCPNPGNCFGLPAGGNWPVAHVIGGGSAVGGGPPVGGNNYIQTIDPGPTVAARVEPSPAKFGALYSLGRTLSFDTLVRTNGGGGIYDPSAGGFAPLVAIETLTGVLVYLTSDLPDIDGAWKHYDITLSNSSEWFLFSLAPPTNVSDPDFATLLSLMTRVTLISEWLVDETEADTGGIDNFAVVPIPATLPLLAAGLLGVRLARRRRGRAQDTA